MALKQPLFFENNTDRQNADEVRLLVKGLLGGVTGATSGVAHPDHFKVTEKSGTPDMSVDVAAGHVFIEGSRNSAQGVYHLYNDGAVNVPLSASDPINPRIDIIYVRLRDSAYDAGFDGDDDAEIVVAEGTPAAVPSDPTITDEDYLVLARVTVGAGVSSITSADITDIRAMSSLWTKPRGIVAQARRTANVNVGTAATDIAGLSTTYNFESGRFYRITISGGVLNSAGVVNAGNFFLREGSTQIGPSCFHGLNASGTPGDWFLSSIVQHVACSSSPVSGFTTISPGAHTYKVSASVAAGTGVFIGDAPNTAYLLIEDIGGFRP